MKELKERNIFSCRPLIKHNVLSLETIDVILHGLHNKTELQPRAGDGNQNDNDSKKHNDNNNEQDNKALRSRTLRSSCIWPGIVSIDNESNGRFLGITDVVTRGYGRTDYTLGQSLFQKLLCKSEYDWIHATADELASKRNYVGPIETTAHIMVVRTKATNQHFHCDDEESNFYYTMLFPLTNDNTKSKRAGITEFKVNAATDAKGNARPIGPRIPTECIIFNGETEHRGQENLSKESRIFFYVAITTLNSGDANLAVGGMKILQEEKIKLLKSYNDIEDIGLICKNDIFTFLCDDDNLDENIDKDENEKQNSSDIEPTTTMLKKCRLLIGKIDAIIKNVRNGRILLGVYWANNQLEKDPTKYDFIDALYDEVDLDSAVQNIGISTTFTSVEGEEAHRMKHRIKGRTMINGKLVYSKIIDGKNDGNRINYLKRSENAINNTKQSSNTKEKKRRTVINGQVVFI